MASGNGKRPLAPHVAAAVAGTAQCKPAAGPARPGTAAHVAAAIQRGHGGAAQQRPAGPTRPAMAPHVAAAIGRPAAAATVQRKPAGPAPLPAPARPIPPPPLPPRSIQRMELYSDDPVDPNWLKVIEHDQIDTNLDLDFGSTNKYYLEGDSDDDDVIETTKNFYRAHRDITQKLGKGRKLKPPPKRGTLKKLKLSDNPSQWKRVNTEYIGETGGFHTMIEKGYKMGLPTGVLGGRGLDQVWYKGSLTNKTLTEVVVVECKGPGANLSKTQQGDTAAKLSTDWVRKNAKSMKGSDNVRRRRLGKYIRRNTGTGKVRGLIVKHDKNGVRKVGKMHNL